MPLPKRKIIKAVNMQKIKKHWKKINKNQAFRTVSEELTDLQ